MYHHQSSRNPDINGFFLIWLSTLPEVSPAKQRTLHRSILKISWLNLLNVRKQNFFLKQPCQKPNLSLTSSFFKVCLKSRLLNSFSLLWKLWQCLILSLRARYNQAQHSAHNEYHDPERVRMWKGQSSVSILDQTETPSSSSSLHKIHLFLIFHSTST